MVGAIVGIAGGVASLGGSLLSSSAATSAADTQAQAANNAAALVNQQFQQTQQNLAPFLATGTSAFNQLGTIFGLNSGNGPFLSGQGPPAATAAGQPDGFNASLDANGNPIGPMAGGQPSGGVPSGFAGTMYDPANANTPGSSLNNILQLQLTNGIPLNGTVNDGAGGVYTYQNGQFVPLAGGAAGAGQQGAPGAPGAAAGVGIDSNASSNVLASYGLPGLTYNPAQYGLGNGVYDPSQFGLGNGVYNPAQFGLGNGTFDPSQYGLGNGMFQPTQAQLEATPGYQFNLSQGLKAIQNNATHLGQGVSGAAMKGAAQYATGLADNTLQTQAGIFNTNLANAKSIYGGNLANTQGIYNSNLNNTKGIFTGNLANTQSIFQSNLGNVINPLLSYAQLGENAGVNLGNTGASAINSQANLLVGGANAQAAGQVGSANALASGTSALSQAPLNALLYQKLLGTGGSTSGTGLSSTDLAALSAQAQSNIGLGGPF